MSIHNKMTSDYLWVRHAPVDEGAKVRYSTLNPGTMASTTCMRELLTASNDFK